ncbi:MAG TPA: hypothetical protein VD706_03230, partial [Candidatus Saccharimonadales bacterium]|nr:hypothetical protein [Candidatus Saccharimonadales bacterium]
MVTETKTKPASFDNSNTPGVKLGGGNFSKNARKFQLPPLRPGVKKILIASVLIILVAGFWFIYGNHFGDKLYAEAAGHKIYKQDVKDLIGKNKGISDHNAAEILADKYLYEAMAKEYDIRITDQDIRTAYGSTINQQKTQNLYAYQSRVNDLYYKKLQENNQGIYKGYLLAAHFNRNIELQPQPENQQSFPTNAGNPAAIAADKQYAKDFITNLYNQVKARKITWDQAAQMERADPQIGLNMYP